MAISSDLPPLVLELRAKAGELYSTLGKVKSETKAMADDTAASTAGMASKTEKASTSMGSKLKSLGSTASKALLPLGLGAVAVGYESLKSATEFQKSTTLLVTAGGEAKSNLANVQNGIKQIAMATGENANDLSDGMYIVEKAGMHGAAGLTVLKAAAQSAMAEGTDMPTMTNAITSALMSYGKGSNYAATMASQMDRAAGMAKTTMQNFAGSLSTVLPIASASGISFAQVGGAIATLTQHGTSADEATQELANTIRNLQAPNQVAQKAMQQLGLNVNDVETKLGSRGLTGTISLLTNAIKSKMGPAGTVVVNAFQQQASASQDLQVMLSKMPPALEKQARAFANGAESYTKFNKYAKTLGGTNYETAKQFISLTSKAEGFNNILQSGQPAQQTAAKMLKDVMGGATGLNTALMLSGHNATYFNKAVAEVQGQAAKANGDISNWAETQSTLSIQLAKAKQHIAVLGLDIGAKLIPIVEKMLEVTSSVFNWLGKHKDVLIALAAILGGVLVAGIVSFVASLLTANVVIGETTILLAPIALGVAALIAVVVLLAMHWKQIWNAIKSITASVVKFLVGLWNKLVTTAETVVDSVRKAFESAWNWIKKTTEGAWNAILKFFRGIWDDIKKVFDSVINHIKSFLSEAWDFVRTTADTAWNTIKTIIMTPINAIENGIENAFHKVETFFTGAWSRITGAARGAWQLFKQYVITPVKDLWTDIQRVVNKFTGFFSNIWDTIKKDAAKIWNDVKNGVVNFFRNLPGEIVNALGSLAGDMINIGANIVHWIISGIGNIAGDIGSAIGSGISSAVHGVGSFFGSLLHFASGGVVSKPTLAVVGEAEPEYIIPQSVLKGMTGGSGVSPLNNTALGTSSAGGIIARIAEAGNDGAVIPLGGKPSFGGGVVNNYYVQVSPQGSVITEQDLAQVVRTQLLRLGARHGGVDTYQPYRR